MNDILYTHSSDVRRALYSYSRRVSRAVTVGKAVIGGDAPILVQSMTNTPTLDAEATAAQARRIAESGGELVRVTTQGVREAQALTEIRDRLTAIGCDVPLSADVHFNPKAALEAATRCDKVRINPGNFTPAGATIESALLPLLKLCREHGTSIRLGVNHGSLSPKIMERYGDTPQGMVESAMQYLRIAAREGFHDIVVSMKASNTVVMVESVLLLVKAMEQEGMNYPLHLGVTEAGDAEDGRIKSAVGIGTLLHLGIGDTIRVSLTEEPEREVPVARELISHISRRPQHTIHTIHKTHTTNNPLSRAPINKFYAAHYDEEFPKEMTKLKISDPSQLGELAARIDAAINERICESGSNDSFPPILMEIEYHAGLDLDTLRIRAAADFGALLLTGYGNAISVQAPDYDAATLGRLELDILQAARLRFTKTEFISCPGCGRTLFDIQKRLHDVKQAINELGIKGLKIGVMGCIVNGPGEMADADYGYVGAGPGRVSIYRGRTAVIKNIPDKEALPQLIRIIKEDRK